MTPTDRTKATGDEPMAFNSNNQPTEHSPPSTRSQRLPAYGRRLRDALRAGLRPCKGGGTIVVTTQWDYASAFDPGRLVCPTDAPATSYEFGYLIGCPVVVLVPGDDEVYGESLLAAVREAGASVAVLSVNREHDR